MTSQAETEKLIREKLESTGQFGKMRAMIVDASLQALSKDADAAAGMFTPKPTLVTAKSSDEGTLALSAVVEYLEYLGLDYTVSVLKTESGVSTADLKDSSALATALHTTGDVALLSLLAGGGCGHTGVSVPHPLPTATTLAAGPTSAVVPAVNEAHRAKPSPSPSSSSTSVTSEEDEPRAVDEPREDEEGAAEEPARAESVGSASIQTDNNDDGGEPAAPQEAGAAKDEDEVSQPAGGEDSTYFISKWRKRNFVRHGEVTGQQVQLEYLTDCTVAVLDELDSMTVDDCEGGELIIAACEGSVFLRNCKNMTVHVACKQLRTRDCEHVDLHIFTTTDPVVEMSHHITFRPFHLRLPGLEAHFKDAHLDPKTNRFVHVYDFTVDEPDLPKPHFEVKFPDHGVAMEDRYAKYGDPVCPPEIEDLVALRLMPASSSESGQNKSYDIKTGALAWAATADAGAVESAESSDSASDKSEDESVEEPAPAAPPVVPSVVPSVATTGKPPIAVAPTLGATPGGLDDQEYSDFDDEFEDDEDDKYEVDEDDDDF